MVRAFSGESRFVSAARVVLGGEGLVALAALPGAFCPVLGEPCPCCGRSSVASLPCSVAAGEVLVVSGSVACAALGRGWFRVRLFGARFAS